MNSTDSKLNGDATAAALGALVVGPVMRDRLAEWLRTLRETGRSRVWPCRVCLLDPDRSLEMVAVEGLCAVHEPPPLGSRPEVAA